MAGHVDGVRRRWLARPMIAPKPTGPAMTPQAEAERAARIAREAAALRANLARRKTQQRGQAATTASVSGVAVRTPVTPAESE